MTRCKPNDLAVINNDDGCPAVRPYLGRLLTVRQSITNIHGEVSWTFDGVIIDSKIGPWHCIPDVMLKPIRGSDGKDEMLLLAGHPRLTELLSSHRESA